MADKQCEFALAAFGISGLETAFGSLMSLVHNGEIGLMILLSKLAVEPARILEGGDKEVPLPFNNPIPRGLGTLRIGAIADITIFDPEAEWVVDPQAFASKGKNTPWAGRLLKGKVMATVVGGKIVYKDEAVEIRSAGL
jgi:dihydroorotase